MRKVTILACLLLACLMAGCSTLASFVGLDGLVGFDSVSKKALEQGFIEIDWLNDEDLKETISELCSSGNFSVSYNDRRRMLEFVAINSKIRLHVFNNRIEFVYIDQFQYESVAYGDGWANPARLELECYGEKISERIRSGEVTTTNKSYYNKYSQKTVYTRYQSLTHIMSDATAAFLNRNWNNNDLYLMVYGDKNFTYKIRNNDLVNLYRTLYEALFPYEFLSDAADSAIVDFINSLRTVSSYQAASIIYYISLNDSLTAEQIKLLDNLVNSKIR